MPCYCSPKDKIRVVDMFDGRLAKHGVHEVIIPPALRAICGTTLRTTWSGTRSGRASSMAEGINVEREEVIS